MLCYTQVCPSYAARVMMMMMMHCDIYLLMFMCFCILCLYIHVPSECLQLWFVIMAIKRILFLRSLQSCPLHACDGSMICTKNADVRMLFEPTVMVTDRLRSRYPHQHPHFTQSHIRIRILLDRK